MYTITRKLAVVCIAVVLSVLMYGCGGGDNKQVEMMMPPTDGDGMGTPHDVDLTMVMAGTTIMPGTFSIQPDASRVVDSVTFTCPAGGPQCDVTVNADGTVMSDGGAATAMSTEVVTGANPVMGVTPGLIVALGRYLIEPGETADAGDVIFTCPEDGGLSCDVFVAEDADGNTFVRSIGGTAMAMDSEDGTEKLETPNTIGITQLAGGYTIEPGDYPLNPGETADAGDVTFTCPEGGLPCAVSVEVDDAVTTVMSLGAAATVGYNMAITRTRTAQGLHSALDAASPTGVPEDTVVVKRSTDGSTTTIMLTPGTETSVGFKSEPVDEGHGIDGWMGQTMNRGGGKSVLTTPEEATVYTNIVKATPAKLKYADGRAPNPDVSPFVIDPNQEIGTEPMSTFTGAYIAGGGRIPGTFTCVLESGTCATIGQSTPNVHGVILLSAAVGNGWAFESNDEVEVAAIQDNNYMYFGYWLQSPADASELQDTTLPSYNYAAFYSGANEFDRTNIITVEDALTADYEGGAAGMYTTRKIVLNEMQEVDPQSHGFHGRFTAKAMLTANFGGDADDANQIEGTITEFFDGEMNLGFQVTLKPLAITTGTGDMMDADSATAVFGESDISTAGTGMGTWSARFFNAPAAADAMDEDPSAPSGVAGKFGVSSTYTKVVGAFAAENNDN